ncbi:MAG TPA: 16S rRNA (cytosine(1402)-N(4))-methyltransferase RsmH, partial [candidate division Zixibacteria bacterium]|nr:16S rRNA (cytosine(1402)-N(4))-methyltransferase RsmH [candidate division Zixibacteria bacterium]
MSSAHVPVMVREALGFLNPEPAKRYLDGTVGGGGHAERILSASAPSGRLLGLDRDAAALEEARNRLRVFGARVILRQANFAEARRILAEIEWGRVHGALLDLGVSSLQLDTAERGFSFQVPARLDMRMDQSQPLDAYEIVNTYPAAEIERILREYGEEPQARRIARAIVERRREAAITTTADLAELVRRAKRHSGRRADPATQTFQALRIAVNRELESLERFLGDGFELLEPRGRMVIISFHSLEDRMVKDA